ncbi:MAG: glycosyltransferase family 1 protein, partial [Pedobacter sp.]
YLYFPTFYGLRVSPEKSILIPTAHDEPPIYFPIFRLFFKLPKAILYNTQAERLFINKLFDNSSVYSDVVGVGIEQSKKIDEISDIKDPYIIYIGRIDPAKGCEILFDYFLKYKKSSKNDLKLVLVGQAFMDIPVSKDILQKGFVNEETKEKLLYHSKALIIPSFYESLSLVTLESMMAGVPVIANDYSEVLKNHIQQSQGGYLFSDAESFKNVLETLLNPTTDIPLLKSNAKRYVMENYNWDVVINKIHKAIKYVLEIN